MTLTHLEYGRRHDSIIFVKNAMCQVMNACKDQRQIKGAWLYRQGVQRTVRFAAFHGTYLLTTATQTTVTLNKCACVQLLLAWRPAWLQDSQSAPATLHSDQALQLQSDLQGCLVDSQSILTVSSKDVAVKDIAKGERSLVRAIPEEFARLVSLQDACMMAPSCSSANKALS
jgi:hypothetical protein